MIKLAVDLSVELLGKRFKNPFILASAAPTSDAKHIIRGAKAGWAGAVTKTIVSDSLGTKGYIRPSRFSAPNSTVYSALHHQGGFDVLGKDAWISREFRLAKAANIPIIGSILGSEAEEWAELAHLVDEAGADMIELNLAYLKGMDKPECVRDVVKATKEACSIPVIAKLTPNVTPSVLEELARTVERAGADVISAINSVKAIAGIDVETGRPLNVAKSKRDNRLVAPYSAISGDSIRPIALRCVHQIVTAVDLPVIGIGGVMNWRSAVEFMMIGSSCVQCSTAPMIYGYEVVGKMLNGLVDFMMSKGYQCLDDFRGISLDYLGDREEIDTRYHPVAEVNEMLCSGCGLCKLSCDTEADAIAIVNGKARIDPERCVGCNLCTLVCPAKAISVSFSDLTL